MAPRSIAKASHFLYSRRCIEPALRERSRKVQQIYVEGDAQPRWLTRGPVVLGQTRERLTQLCGTSRHGGIVAKVGQLSVAASLPDLPPTRVVLFADGIQDVQNLGAAVRVAAAAGATFVATTTGSPGLSLPSISATSAGTVESMGNRLYQVPRKGWSKWLAGTKRLVLLTEAGPQLLTPTLFGESDDTVDTNSAPDSLADTTMIVVGSEDRGISSSLLDRFPHAHTAIPSHGVTLNATTAAAIALFTLAPPKPLETERERERERESE
jgi:tRNA G18 (ribose-2'-O)-methylase SpoU